MKVLVIGATGFTGSHIVPLFIEKGFDVRCLARPTSDRSILSGLDIEWWTGDVKDEETLKSAMSGMDVLVNVVSLGFGGGPGIVRAAEQSSIHRTIFLSTTAIFTSLEPSTKQIRKEAEKAIISSSLRWTILRPTMIYGGSRDRNICRLLKFMRRWPLLPVLGSGQYLLQPVYVKDVAKAVVDCLSSPQTERKIYDISGGAPLTFNQLIRVMEEKLNRRVRKIHLPYRPVSFTLALLETLGLSFPIGSEQICRLNEHKAFDHEAARADFGYSPLTFEEGIARQIEETATS